MTALTEIGRLAAKRIGPTYQLKSRINVTVDRYTTAK